MLQWVRITYRNSRGFVVSKVVLRDLPPRVVVYEEESTDERDYESHDEEDNEQ